jgi:hypothetical protein
MIFASVAGHVFFAPFFSIGLALVIWNRRLARAFDAAHEAYVEALGSRWLRRRWDKNKRWYRPIAHLTIIAIGTLFMVVSLVGVFVPSQ